MQRHCFSSWGVFSTSAATLPLTLFRLTFFRVRAAAAQLLIVLGKHFASPRSGCAHLSLSPPIIFVLADAPKLSLLFECTKNGIKTESRLFWQSRRSNRFIGGESSFNDADGKVLSIRHLEALRCRAMSASSDDESGDSRTSGDARRSAPSIPT